MRCAFGERHARKLLQDAAQNDYLGGHCAAENAQRSWTKRNVEREMAMSTTFPSHETRARATAPNASAVRWVRVDALVSGASGLLLAAAAPLLDDLLGAPIAVLLPLGLFLLAYSSALVLVARRGAQARAVKAVVAGNAIWVVASVAVVLADVLTLTTTGVVFTLLQAAAVAVLAELQFASARRPAAP
jgi:hypothetical protein